MFCQPVQFHCLKLQKKIGSSGFTPLHLASDSKYAEEVAVLQSAVPRLPTVDLYRFCILQFLLNLTFAQDVGQISVCDLPFLPSLHSCL